MKWFNLLIIFTVILIIIFIGGWTNYKTETLYCSKNSNECHVERTNLFGIKSTRKLLKYSDIKTAGYIRQKVKGNRYANGYTDYQLVFITKNNARKIIFSEVYLEYPQIANKIKKIKHHLNNGSGNFVIIR